MDYGFIKVLVLLFFWVQGKTCGFNAGLKKDEFGFTLVNFKRLLSPRGQPFVFLSQIKQVFFSNFIQESRWKVVLHKTTRS